MTTQQVERIMNVFNEPSTCALKNRAGTYCVGGAIVLTACELPAYGAPSRIRFPNRSVLAFALRVMNPALSYERSVIHASEIIEENDNRQFDAAWSAAIKALTA